MVSLVVWAASATIFNAARVEGNSAGTTVVANPPSLRGTPSWDKMASSSFEHSRNRSLQEASAFGGYDLHAHVNCYTNHGGTDLGAQQGWKPGFSAEDCADACDDDDSCSCFVYMSDQGKCFLRSQCILEACEKGVDGQESWQFDTYVAVAKDKTGNDCNLCANGQGKWQHYPEPTSSFDCICQSCDPGYELTDMFCEPSSTPSSAGAGKCVADDGGATVYASCADGQCVDSLACTKMCADSGWANPVWCQGGAIGSCVNDYGTGECYCTATAEDNPDLCN
mmetsp:Transcript_97674/g.174000  ORF Transcript_97674/g.174000 Transcript_97674/m.174000 type:complete len:281 (+) Transcript_97674:42-884(+)